MKRVLTALVITPFFFYVVVYAPWWAFLPVLAGVALICYHEYLGIVRAHLPQAPDPRKNPAGYLAGLLLLLIPWYDMGAFLVLVALAMLVIALNYRGLQYSLPLAAAQTMGVVYIFGAWRCGAALRELSPWWLLFASAVNWVGDTFAYFGGRALGRHKLAPSISPGKSWEGTLVSVAVTTAVGAFCLHWGFPRLGQPEVELLPAILLTMLANVAGQLGDLAESAIKRGAGVKDSGNSLPGHGGWLDRVDSSLFSIPVVYWLIQLRWFVP
jgi:phosphatidate cytidylyltransferase